MRLFGAVTKADIENEVRAVQKLCIGSHPNIVQVFDLGQMRSNSTFYYIDMELCDISLGHYMQGKRSPSLPLSWDEFRNDFENICIVNADIIEGLIFIHSNNEVHRDLSPQNSIPGLICIADRVFQFFIPPQRKGGRLLTSGSRRPERRID